MATRKIQVPAVGGVRKVIQPAAGSNATTIAGLEGQTLTVAQLKTLIGNTGTSVQQGSSGAAAAPASLIVGPGLTGGGALIGAVPVGLRFPTPPVMWTDSLLPDDFIAPVGGGGTGGSATLAGLSDVALSGLTAGQVLEYNGSKWANAAGGGGGGTFVNGNITPDFHPASPDPNNDEFEGSALSAQWTWTSQGTTVATVQQGYLKILGNNGSTPSYLFEPLTSTTTFKYRAKMMLEEGNPSFCFGGLCLYNSANGHNVIFGASTVNNGMEIYSATSLGGTYTNLGSSGSFGAATAFAFFEIASDGTNIYFRASLSGKDDTFQTIFTQAISGNIAATTHIGFMTNGLVATGFICDWIRRVDTGIAPNTGASITNPNITPDTHPAIATAWDDEFEFGTSIDLTGARFSGANPWTIVGSGGTLSSVVAGGGLASLTTNGGSTTTGTFYSQPVPSGNFQITWKGYLGSLVWYNSSTFKAIYFGWNGGNLQLQTETRNVSTNSYTFGSTLATQGWNSLIPVYLQVEVNGANIIFRYSASGMPGTFITLSTQTIASWIGTLTNFAILANGGSPATTTTAMDWIRRTA